MGSEARFEGFGEGTRAFLRGIAANNEKAWFEVHRADYDAHYVRAALAFIRELGPRLQAISPLVHAEARINGSLMRINRDVRFSKDKRPYKDHLDMWFWEGEHRGWDSPGFFMRLTSDSLVLGAGMHRLAGEQLGRYRDGVVGESGAELETTLQRIAASGYEIGGAGRVRVPKGFDAGHERAHLLLHEGLYATLEEPYPKVAASPKLVDYAVRHFAAVAPVNDWLREALAT